MGRINLIRTSEFSYHIVARANHKHWFGLPREQVWKIVERSIKFAYSCHPVKVEAFVLMDNHYHLLVKTPDKNIDEFMYVFNKSFSLYLRVETNMINKMFGGRYKWSLIEHPKYYMNVLKYIYRNPIAAGLCFSAEDYRYCSYYFIVNQQSFFVPLSFDKSLHEDVNFQLWINKEPKSKCRENLKRALHYRRFKLGKDPLTRKSREILDQFHF